MLCFPCVWLPCADFGGQDKDLGGIPKAEEDVKGSFSHVDSSLSQALVLFGV